MMNPKTFYVIEYKPGDDGCPYYLSGTLNHEAWEWSLFEPDPDKIEIQNEYVYQITDDEIKDVNFDFYGGDTYFFSDSLLAICEEMGVPFRQIPIKIVMPNGWTKQNYSVFLPKDNISLIDSTKSDFKLERNMLTGEVEEYESFPGNPIYSWIRKFTPRADINKHLFRCLDNMEMVCSSEFMEKCKSRELTGLNFNPIDNEYVYDPWHEIE